MSRLQTKYVRPIEERDMKSTLSILAAIVAVAVTCDSVSAAVLQANPLPRGLPECGSVYAPPFANPAGPVQRRVCPAPLLRAYKPRFQTIGHEVLQEESEACFVPDSAFELLDSLIERGRQKYKPPSSGATDWQAEAVRFFEAMGLVLNDAGFQLYIPLRRSAMRWQIGS